MTASPRLMFFAVFLMAASAILYELLLAAVLSYLLGATILYFSLTIGVFLFALGIGAWWSRRLEADLLSKFLTIEVILGILGGLAIPLIFAVFALLFRYLGGHVFNNLFSFLFQAGLAEILFHGVSFAAIVAIGVLVGLELPIFTRLAHESLALKEALARVFFWDYAGALAGSVLFPLILLPMLGFLRTGFLVGLVNIAAALMLGAAVGAASPLRQFSRTGRALFVVGAVTLVLGFGLAPRLEQFFTRQIFTGSEILWNQTSPYQSILLTKNREGKTSLFLNGELQFQSGILEQRYHETFAHPVMAFMGEKARRILILGGGDGLLLRELVKYPQVEAVTMVDIDTAVTDLARTHPALRVMNQDSLADRRLTLIHDDAFRWLRQRPARESPFDAAFLDLPDPVDDALTRLYSREFYLMLRRNLTPDGMMVTQAGSLPSRFHESVKRTLKSAGYRVLSLHPAGADPMFGIAGVFESSFVSASPSAGTIETFYQSLASDKNASAIMSPYLGSKVLRQASAHSLFYPVRSFGVGGSLTRRLMELQTASADLLLSHLRAPPALTRAQVQNLITDRGIFSSY